MPTGSANHRPAAPQRGSCSQWIRYLLGRAVGVLGVTVALLILAFLLIYFVPGDPARNIVGLTATQQQVEVVRHQLGLNQPFDVRAWQYVVALFHGDLGKSFVTQQPITQMLGQRLPVTAAIAFGGLVVVLVLALPIGMAIAFFEWRGTGRMRAGVFTVITGLLGAFPEYITGTLLVIVFALRLGWLPAQGTGFQGMLLPALAVGLAPTAAMSRLARNETRSVLAQEYISTARSKRISARRLLAVHVLPNVATSMLTAGGILLVALLGSTVIVENVFNMPGLGTQIVQSILSSDYPVIQGIILTLGVLATLMGLVIDIILGVLDPRVLQRTRVR